ncbi:MAG TPA: RnfABCDGE type electron transport complex subunit D [Candidatus Omnitrophota bacterium]|nr:RnfABCDGE type electron transport complex subunit D [Candidatus Omnitrophota bacterium]HQL41643.1 RnfABCDGE type electron transport complex subunit D [Candidatus Omnitrophota bacterium]
MSEQKLTVSLSPHVSSPDNVRRIMMDVLLALSPAALWSVYLFGFQSLRVILIGIGACVFFEYVAQRFILKVKPSVDDGSAAVTGLLLAFNLPSHIPSWMIIVGSFVAIIVAKMTFGGLGNNPFNPALVGRVFMLISFPAAMTSWPVPLLNRWKFVDAVTAATPLSVAQEGLKNGTTSQQLLSSLPSYQELFFGYRGGCLGEVSVFLLLLGGLYLLYRKVIRLQIPLAVIGSVFVFSAVLWFFNPGVNMPPVFHILTGGVFLGAIFMATDMVTSPMTVTGMVIFGIAIGILTVIIRVFGAYPEGMSFAILIMNAFVPLIDSLIKPRKYGMISHG